MKPLLPNHRGRSRASRAVSAVKVSRSRRAATTALITALYVAGVDAGDEVIASPFTFNATYNAVLMHKALPVLDNVQLIALLLTLIVKPSGLFGQQKELEERV